MPVRDVGLDSYSKMRAKNSSTQSQLHTNKDCSVAPKKFINIISQYFLHPEVPCNTTLLSATKSSTFYYAARHRFSISLCSALMLGYIIFSKIKYLRFVNLLKLQQQDYLSSMIECARFMEDLIWGWIFDVWVDDLWRVD